MPKQKQVFYCTECGNDTITWQGRCPACGAWNSIVEHAEKPARGDYAKGGSAPHSRAPKAPVRISELDTEGERRISTGIGELDRVLGGGAVEGSVILIGGAPGIGKSTLLLQFCGRLAKRKKILYASGEESARQVKMRAKRLSAEEGELYILSETELGSILAAAEEARPDVLIVDSIQTVCNESLDASPGSVVQVKDCTMAFMRLAKETGVTVFVVGHVNKEGAIAGPKVLEHMVDCVLYFEGDGGGGYRIVRAAKNRFGSTNEIGVFEMGGGGLKEVPNPSETLLSGRPAGAAGSCVCCVMEGARPILAEIQALIAPTSFNVPRRNSNGLDYNRAMLLLAVLEKRGGLKLSASDAYINVVGGLQVDEPAADLAAILAIASGFTDRPIEARLAAIGEVGLTGELRSVMSLEQRLAEAARLGFSACIIPKGNKGKYTAPQGLNIIEAANIGEALSYSIGAYRK